MSEPRAACLNCGALPAGDFCQACGQQSAASRLMPKGIAADFAGNVFNLDTGLWRTFLGLLTRPGEVARRYVGGERRRYLNPLKYFFFALAVYFLAAAAVRLKVSDLTSARLTVTDGQKEQQQEAAQALIDFLDQHQRLLLIAGVPVYAWVLVFVFRRRGYNFAEVCVLLLYSLAQITLLVRLPMLLATAATGRSFLLIAFPLQVAYLAWATKRFFDTSWWRALLAAGVSIFSWIATLILIVLGCLVVALQLS